MVGAALTNPADLLKVRMQAAATVPQQTRRGLFLSLADQAQAMRLEAAHVLSSEGGVRGLWQGAGPNVARAALLTASQVGTYDASKSALRERWRGRGGSFPQPQSTALPSSAASGGGEPVLLHFAASMVAGVAAAVVTSPVDSVKSRLMVQRSRLRGGIGGGGGGEAYRGMLHCASETVRKEGWLGLYKGFNAQWLRIGPHTTLTFLAYEQLRRAIGMRPV
jgi:solute carrier family 25 protein 14/30